FLLQSHDQSRDRAGAAGAYAAQTKLDDAPIDTEHFDGAAIQIEIGAEFVGENLGDALFEFARCHGLTPVRPAMRPIECRPPVALSTHRYCQIAGSRAIGR